MADILVSGLIGALGFEMDGDLEVRILYTDRSKPPHSFWPKEHDSVHQWDKLNEEGYGVFFGITRRRGGGKATNCFEAHALWCDLDGKDFDRDDPVEGKAKALCAIEERIPQLWLRPSAIIDSGGGYHCYWFLDEAYDLSTPVARIRFEAILRGVATHLNGDLNCCDVPRVLRLPGFKNTKYPDLPVVRIVDMDTTHFLAIDDLTNVIDPVKKDQRAIEPSVSPAGDRKVLEGGRHDYLLKWAGRLRRGGASKEATLNFLRAENLATCDPPEDDAEVVFLANDTSGSRWSSTDPVLKAEGSFAENVALGSAIAGMEIKPPEWLIQDLFMNRGFHLVAGPPNSYKSWLTMAAMIALTNGAPFSETLTTNGAGSTLFIGAEGGRQILRRAQMLAAGFGMPLNDDFQVHSNHPDLGSDESREEVREYVQEHKIDALVLDPARFLFNLQNDKHDGWTSVIRWFREMAEICSLVVVHHTRKLPSGVAEELSMDSISGPGSLIAAADLIFITRRMTDTSNFELINPKFRDGALLKTASFHFDATFDAFKIMQTATADAKPLARNVLLYMSTRKRVSKKDIQTDLKVHITPAGQALKELMDSNEIDSYKVGRDTWYFIPEKDEEGNPSTGTPGPEAGSP